MTPANNVSRRPSSSFDPLEARNGNHKTTDLKDSCLVGNEREDEKIICNWFATSYGEVNKEYHEAYSREILRQIRAQSAASVINEPGIKSRANSWFG